MRKFLILAAIALPLAGCGYGYDYGYSRNAYNPYTYNSYGYNPLIGAVGALGGSSFSQAAASACANHASRYGAVRVTSVRRTDNDRMKVYGYVSRGFGSDNWDCTFRSDGRITDFDL